ncbi:MAG: hypothetical protein NDJ89_05225 [Oligoflexia bacterium]|nr:hypothetical protein [Oligoflexia bacterium]
MIALLAGSALMLSLSGGALAAEGWSGSWEGEGTVTRSDGRVALCGRMEIVFSHRKQVNWEGLWVLSGLPDCALASVLSSSFLLEVRDGELYQIEEKLGSLDADTMRILKYSTFYKEYVELRREGRSALAYRKVLTLVGATQEFVIEGRLQKK